MKGSLEETARKKKMRLLKQEACRNGLEIECQGEMKTERAGVYIERGLCG